LWLLVEFVPRTSSTPVATWFWQTEGRSAERVISGVRLSWFVLSEFQSPSRRIFIGSIHSPLSGRLIGPSETDPCVWLNDYRLACQLGGATTDEVITQRGRG
jgi:hypothetical protein